MSLLLSIIIPTHNRRDQLQNNLEALSHQSVDPHSFEVLVVADGCTDNTLEMLADFRPGYPLQAIGVGGLGPAAARNAGAAQAHGPLLVFLDDDIAVSPDFVLAHLQAHARGEDRVVIGYLPTVLETQTGFFRIALRNWWEAMFERMRQPGHRFSYMDLLSGNFSIPVGLFTRLGGFNPELRCHEDYEFGMRLVQAGIPFSFVPAALGHHQEGTDIDRALRRKYEEGDADVVLGRLYPALRNSLLMAKMLVDFPLPVRVIGFLAFRMPLAGSILISLARVALPLLEWFRLRLFWRVVLDGLMGYWYWKGVARHFGNLNQVRGYLGEAPPAQPDQGIELDLSAGLSQAEQLLDEARPAAAILRYGPHLVGWVPAQPGTERLRGVHLRRILATELLPAWRRALVQAGSQATSTHL